MISSKLRKIFFFIGLIFIITPVIGSFIKIGIDGYERAMFEDMIRGTANKPFVYRCLVPFTIRGVSALLPENIKTEINIWGANHIHYLNVDRNNIDLSDLLIATGLWFISILGFAYSVMKLLRYFYDINEYFIYTVAAMAVAGLPIFFKSYSYLYDFTNLFLFTLCLYYLVKEKWLQYLLSLIIATTCKETTILLIFIYIFHYRNYFSKQYFRNLLLYQIIIYVFIKLILLIIYYDNPGTFVEFHLMYNLKLDPYSISQFLALIILGVAIIYDWKNKPEFLRHSILIICPLLVLTLFFGCLDEYRDYYEVYPIVILLVTHTIVKILNRSVHF